MKVKNVFRAYDIRGLYPEELGPHTVRLLAAGYLEFLKKTGAVNLCLVGRDTRWSSEELRDEIVEELLARGVEVWDVGVVTTPMFTFAMGQSATPAGIMITASHNSIRYNGLKLYNGAATLSEKTGLQEIKNLVSPGLPPSLKTRRGILIKKDFKEDYIKFLVSQVKIQRKIKAVFDAGGGAVSAILAKFLGEINVEPVVLGGEPDPTLSKRDPNPLLPQAQKAAREAVLKNKAGVGFIFDTDGDRLVVLNEKGESLRGDAILWLLAKSLEPGSTVVYDKIRSSLALYEDLTEGGLRAVPSRVGHSYIKEAMRESDAELGGELSGHFYFKDLFYAESALLACLKLLEILSKVRGPLSELLRPFSRYFHSGEINFMVKDKLSFMRKVEVKYPEARKDYFDGLMLEYPGWWFSVRPSGTEDLLRMVLEARDKKTFEEKKEELSELLLKLGAKPAQASP